MIQCPQCRLEIPPADFNVATDRAFCRQCNTEHRYGELAAVIRPSVDFDANSPPKHIHIFDDGFQQTIVYRRISPILFFFIPFTALWGGGSMYGIYLRHLLKGEPVPADQILFGLPFLFGTVVLLTAILYMMFGKTTIQLQGPESWVFLGVGPIGWRRNFDVDAIEQIRLVDTGTKINEQSAPAIELQFRERGALRFGTMLTPDSKSFIAQYLAQRLAN